MRLLAGAVFGLISAAAVGGMALTSPAVLLGGAAHGSAIPARELLASGSATALDNAFWTGWVNVSHHCAASLEVTFTDANNSVSNVVMRCEESTSSSTTADAGADVCCRSVASGVETYTCPCSKKADYTNSGTFGWAVTPLHSLWLNCNFSAEGTPAAADTVAWKMVGEHCK